MQLCCWLSDTDPAWRWRPGKVFIIYNSACISEERKMSFSQSKFIKKDKAKFKHSKGSTISSKNFITSISSTWLKESNKEKLKWLVSHFKLGLCLLCNLPKVHNFLNISDNREDLHLKFADHSSRAWSQPLSTFIPKELPIGTWSQKIFFSIKISHLKYPTSACQLSARDTMVMEFYTLESVPKDINLQRWKQENTMAFKPIFLVLELFFS